MRNLLFSLLILMVMGCGSSLRTPVRASTGLVSHIGGSTVALMTSDGEGGMRVYCTGVWVGYDEILTAHHCVAAASRQMRGNGEEEADAMGLPIHYIIEREVDQVETEASALHLGKVMALDEDHDLALIRAVKSGIPSHEVVSVVSTMPGLGEHAYVVGHPRGLYWSYVDVVVSSYRGDLSVGKEGPFVQIAGNVWFGNSGGGLFDSSGDLVGICSMSVGVPNTSLFIHADSIKKFLKVAREPVVNIMKH